MGIIRKIGKRTKHLVPRWLYPYVVKIYSSLQWVRTPGPPTYNLLGLVTTHAADFEAIKNMKEAWATGCLADPDQTQKIGGLLWQAHTLCWAGDVAARLDGDFIECGVKAGMMSRTVIEFTNFKELNKKFYLLDTFEGCDPELFTDEERETGMARRSHGAYANSYDDVVNTFSQFKNVKIVKGAIPSTLSEVDSDKIAYLHIDMNCTAPEIAAIKYFWPNIVQGGIVILDDYGWNGHKLQKAAFVKWSEDVGVVILRIPTGQGLIIKH